MIALRKIEVFTAGCPACTETIDLVNRIACPGCEVEILDMHQPEAVSRAKRYGVRRVPSVVVDDTLAPCCSGPGPDEKSLRAAGVGQP